MKTLPATLACVAFILVGWLGGSLFPFGFVRGPENEIPQKDTVIVVDTVRVDRPVPYYVEMTPDTVQIIIRDTVKASSDTVALQIERKEYRDTSYRAVVTGYRPSLEEIEVYQKTVTIWEPYAVPAPDKRWGLGVSAGYGIGPSGLTPCIVVGVSYDIISW